MLPADISQEVAERILEHVFPSGSCVCGFFVVCFLVVCLVRAEVTGSEGTFLAFNKVTPHPAVSLRESQIFPGSMLPLSSVAVSRVVRTFQHVS